MIRASQPWAAHEGPYLPPDPLLTQNAVFCDQWPRNCQTARLSELAFFVWWQNCGSWSFISDFHSTSWLLESISNQWTKTHFPLKQTPVLLNFYDEQHNSNVSLQTTHTWLVLQSDHAQVLSFSSQQTRSAHRAHVHIHVYGLESRAPALVHSVIVRYLARSVQLFFPCLQIERTERLNSQIISLPFEFMRTQFLGTKYVCERVNVETLPSRRFALCITPEMAQNTWTRRSPEFWVSPWSTPSGRTASTRNAAWPGRTESKVTKIFSTLLFTGQDVRCCSYMQNMKSHISSRYISGGLESTI